MQTSFRTAPTSSVITNRLYLATQTTGCFAVLLRFTLGRFTHLWMFFLWTVLFGIYAWAAIVVLEYLRTRRGNEPRSPLPAEREVSACGSTLSEACRPWQSSTA
jgi:hypothetical protein